MARAKTKTQLRQEKKFAPVDITTITPLIQLEGFQREEGDGYVSDRTEIVTTEWSSHDYSTTHHFVRLTSPDITIIVNFTKDPKCDEFSQLATGHTYFKTGDTWFTFDRRGFNDSFDLYHPDSRYSEKDIPTILSEQVAKCKASIAKGARKPVPDTQSICVTEERRLEIRNDLLTKPCCQLSPGGMGTGYILSLRKKRGCEIFSPKMAEFFELPSVYYSTYDHD